MTTKLTSDAPHFNSIAISFQPALPLQQTQNPMISFQHSSTTLHKKDFSSNPRALRRLRTACKRAKCTLFVSNPDCHQD
ncbi:hypothetical protein EV424DRAFT_1546389 [Suillus variegatus]|nr:hypothetical protein EV424DRAFT_1546389 [Suillus variegatus]